MKRSKFSLSHYKLLTCPMGQLIPITWYEALPGDTIQHSTAALIRVSPLLSPVMHPVRVRIHHWFVPNRLIWEDWEDFITGGPDGTSVPDHPVCVHGTITEGTLNDYLGIPPGSYSPNVSVSALPRRAYSLIYNEHYRDQDLVTELTVSTASGTDATTNGSIQKVAWEKDYFTTARPWEQKGDVVTIPLGDEAPIFGDNMDFDNVEDSANYAQVRDAPGSGANLRLLNTGSANLYGNSSASGTGELKADLSSATGISINDLRLALSIQRYQEARALYGSRYVEYLRYLGVRSSDARLQNPEYLGGGRQVIQFSEVLSTDGSNTGDLKGHGISAIRTNKYRRFFEEHGIVMTLLSIVPKSIYTESLYRGFSREVKEDYFQRELQFIGEQEIPNKEVQMGHSSADDVFGYQARYDEYRHIPSTIAGEFRSTMDHWHYARQFSGDVTLNQSFTDCTPTTRVYAAPSADPLYIMTNHSIQARRMLAKRATSKTF